MELLRLTSKRPLPTILRQSDTDTNGPRRAAGRRPHQLRHRLLRESLDELTAAYGAGASTRELADRYGVGKTAIARLLREQGMKLRNQGLSPCQVTEATAHYEAGNSVAQVAAAMSLSVSSVYDALKRAGVEMRDPHLAGRRASTRI